MQRCMQGWLHTCSSIECVWRAELKDATVAVSSSGAAGEIHTCRSSLGCASQAYTQVACMHQSAMRIRVFVIRAEGSPHLCLR